MTSISPVRATCDVSIPPGRGGMSAPTQAAAAMPINRHAADQLDAMERLLDKLRTALGYGVAYGGGGAAPTGLMFRRDA